MSQSVSGTAAAAAERALARRKRWLGGACARTNAPAATTRSALSRAGEPSGSTVTSSNPVRIPCPLSSARRLTAQHATPYPWWTCSIEMPADTTISSIMAACRTAASGSRSSGSMRTRRHRPANPEATKARASSLVSKPASSATPRERRSSHSSMMPGSPWLTVTRSGRSVHPSTMRRRSLGSATIVADVVSDTGVSGQRRRMLTQDLRARSAIEGFPARLVEGMDVHRVSAGAHDRAGRFRDAGRGARCRRVNPIAIERDLKESGRMHERALLPVAICHARLLYAPVQRRAAQRTVRCNRLLGRPHSRT